MNLAQTHDLLTLIAVYDNRRFGDETVAAWHAIVAGLPFDDCRTAVIKHFATSAEYLMPVHVCRWADEIDHDRRRQARLALEHAEQLALEADPSRHDRTALRVELIAALRATLPEGDPTALRRSEVWAWEQQRARVEMPNPHYDPLLAARLAAEAES